MSPVTQWWRERQVYFFYFLWDICPYQINNWKTSLPLNFQELNSSPSVERKVKSGSWTRRMSSRVPPPTLPPQDLEAWSLLLLQLQWATSYLLHLRPTSLAIRSVWSRYKRWMRSKWVHASVAFSLNALAILILKRVLIFLVYFEFLLFSWLNWKQIGITVCDLYNLFNALSMIYQMVLDGLF